MTTLRRPFLSTYQNRIDAKGRVSVPAKFREILEAQGARSIFARTSTVEPMIEAGGPEWMAGFHNMVESHDPTSELYDDYAMAYLGDSVELSLDSEGRVVLPEMLLRHAGLEDAATFVGLGSHFRIWEPKAFDVRMMKARRSAAEHRGQLRAKTNGGAGE
jgi:MraZ protein